MSTARQHPSPTMTEAYFSSDSSDDENTAYLIATNIFPGLHTVRSTTRIGSLLGKKPNKKRDFNAAMDRLLCDYFGTVPRYNKTDFERRFRMPRSLFDRIYQTIEGKGVFIRRIDAVKKEGIHPLQRVVAALRMLAYGQAADSLDEYLQMSEDSSLLSLKEFCKEIISSFGEEYLRAPNEKDLERIMKINAARGFPGCIGSIDCQHWEWKNFPIAWAGQFKGKEKNPTVVLEAVADGELWIWHCFFGSPGSLNDINILDASSTMQRIREGEFPPSFLFAVNGKNRTILYYLADGIYPSWAIFMKTSQYGTTAKEKAYARNQEAVRKDVERAFGVLLARFHILRNPCFFWKRSDMANVMIACIILHNMIVECRRDQYESDMASFQHYDEARNLFCGGKQFTWESLNARGTYSQGRAAGWRLGCYSCGAPTSNLQHCGTFLPQTGFDGAHMGPRGGRGVKLTSAARSAAQKSGGPGAQPPAWGGGCTSTAATFLVCRDACRFVTPLSAPE